MSAYSEKLKDPRWQKLRLKVFERDGFKCLACDEASKTLHVHHLIYSNVEPWDAAIDTLETLCEDCHDDREAFNEFTGVRSVIPSRFVRVFIGFSCCGIKAIHRVHGPIPKEDVVRWFVKTWKHFAEPKSLAATMKTDADHAVPEQP